MDSKWNSIIFQVEFDHFCLARTLAGNELTYCFLEQILRMFQSFKFALLLLYRSMLGTSTPDIVGGARKVPFSGEMPWES